MARGQILIGGGFNDDNNEFWSTRWLVPSSGQSYAYNAALDERAGGTTHAFLETGIAITYHWRISPAVPAPRRALLAARRIDGDDRRRCDDGASCEMRLLNLVLNS
jgi:hypothetical protein